MKRVRFNFDPELFRKHGVDIDNPNLEKDYEARNEKMERQYNLASQKNKSRAIWSKSLWDSGEIHFTLSDWKPEDRDNPVKAKNLGNKAYRLAKEMEHGHLNVVMSGNAGVGKTSLALAMVDMLRKSGKSALFVSTVALSQLLSDRYEYTDRQKRLEEVTRAMKECDILLLDDLGADGGNVEKVMSEKYAGARKDMQSLLFDVANNRYEGAEKERVQADKNGVELIKPVHQTIITTNNFTDELNRIYGERTISRLVTKDSNHRLAFNDMEDMRTKEGI